MNVPRGTNLRAALTVARLLEDEGLEFYNVLQPSEGNLELYGGPGDDDTANGQLEIWWSVEIEARRWGIKDIVPFIKKMVLDGFFTDLDGRDTGETFRYEYPEASQAKPAIGPDPDAPTPDNVLRLATPKWKVDYRVDPHGTSRTSFSPKAEVDLTRHTIEILF
jgi:hypothetical protein